MITIANTDKYKIIRMTETERNNLTDAEFEALAPEWVDESVMMTKRTDETQIISGLGFTFEAKIFDREGDVLIAYFWERKSND